jgi:predicted Zn-dependent protease
MLRLTDRWRNADRLLNKDASAGRRNRDTQLPATPLLLPGALLAMIAASANGCGASQPYSDFIERLTPSKITSLTAPATAAQYLVQEVKVARVRVYATASYREETYRWQKRFKAIVEHSNKVLVPDLGLKLEIESLNDWQTGELDDSAGAMLRELEKLDRGEGVDLVVGLLPSTARLMAYHYVIGRAHMLGKHLLIRAANRTTAAYAYQLDADQRASLVAKQVLHGERAVFLHEIGHWLGALHVRNPEAIMNEFYSLKAASYSRHNKELMRIVVKHRFGKTGSADASSLWKDLEAYLRKTELASWIAEEKEVLLEMACDRRRWWQWHQRHEWKISPYARSDELDVEENHTLVKAQISFYQDDYEKAWKTLEPLLARQPPAYEVHALACLLSMKRRLPISEIEARCDRMLRLPKSSTGEPSSTNTTPACE